MFQEAITNIASAIRNSRTDVVRSLIAAAEQNENSTPEGLLKPEEIINNVVIDEGTFLHLATKLNQTDIVRLLLAAGADPGIQNNEGQNSVELAVTQQLQAVYTEELLKATAQANIGRICQLIAAGVSVNSVDSPKSGNTALHWAATFANRDTVRCLLDRDANVNVANSNGATPLHDAVHKMDLENVKELLEGGANPLIKAFNGKYTNKTPLDLASISPQITLLLQKYVPNFVNGVDLGNSEKTFQSNSMESLLSFSQEFARGTMPLVPMSNEANSEISIISNHTDVTTPPKPLITNSKLYQLWPQPQRIDQLEGNAFKIPDIINVFIIPGPNQNTSNLLLKTWDTYKTFLGPGYKFQGLLSSPYSEKLNFLTLNVNSDLFQVAESYRINISCDGITIIASDVRGLHNAIATYLQILKLFYDDGSIPQIHVRDWPNILYRGVLMDFSCNGRVPTFDNIIASIDIFAHLKFNQIHFYNQFSFENSWKIAYDSEDLIKLDYHCFNLGISLVPAIDIEHNLSNRDFEDFVLPLRNFLKCFSNSRFIHLGPNLSKLVISNISPNEFLALLGIPINFTLMICCNNIPCDYQLQKMLPENLILLNYGFQLNHNFTKPCRHFNQFGYAVGIVSLADSQNSLAGLFEVTLRNNYQAARCALEEPIIAYIATNWSTGFFPLPKIHSWPGFVVASGLAWNTSVQWDYLRGVTSNVLNMHVFGDKSELLGRVVLGLSHAESHLQKLGLGLDSNDVCDLLTSKGTLLLQLLIETDDANLEYLSVETFAKMIRILKKHQSDLDAFTSTHSLAESWRSEIQLTIDIIHFVCRLGKALVSVGQNPNASMGVAVVNLGINNLAPTTRTDLANRLLGLIEQFREVWLKFNLNCGLDVALFKLISLLELLIPEKVSLD